MGKSTEASKIIDCRKNSLFLVDVMAEIQPLLKAYGLGLQKGMVIFSENSDCFYDAYQYLQRTGAELCKNLKASKRDILNNCLGIHVYDSYDKEREIVAFLSEEGFTPAILVHSVIPDFLRDYENLLVLSENSEILMETKEDFTTFQGYIHENPKLIENSIRIFKGSEFYLEHRWKGQLNLALQTAAEAFSNFYRQSHTEKETEKARASMHKMVEDLTERAECCSGEWDNLDTVRLSILRQIREFQLVKRAEWKVRWPRRSRRIWQCFVMTYHITFQRNFLSRHANPCSTWSLL